jgi:hypothetical protein
MAKRFLESLGEAFEEDVLEEVIPATRRQKAPPKKKPRKRGRKKAILQALDEAFESQRLKQAQSSSKKGGKKSFLRNLNEELGSSDLEGLLPEPGAREHDFDSPASREALTRFTTSLDKDLLAEIRRYARTHQLRVRDVIQEALKIFLQQEE